MRNITKTFVFGACLALTSCGGTGGSGGKANLTPLLVDVKAAPSPAWANAAVTFTASCVSANPNTQAGLTGLEYTWSFRDPAGAVTHIDTTPNGSDVYNFLVNQPDGAEASYKQYQYQVRCTDRSLPGTPSITTAWQTIQIWSDDLTALDSNVCSSGVQGFGWCWQNPTPAGSSLNAVAAVSSVNGWAVGDGGVILETNDGGTTWLTKFPGQASTLQNYLAIDALDQNRAVVAASDGSVLTTINAGATWTRVTPSPALSLTSAAIVSPSIMWAINGSSSVMRTTDGGTSWSRVQPSLCTSSVSSNCVPPGTQLNAIAALDSQTATVVGVFSQLTENDLGSDLGVIAQTLAGNPWVVSEYGLGDTLPAASSQLSGNSWTLYFTSVSMTPGYGMTASPCGSASLPSTWVGGYAAFDVNGAASANNYIPATFALESINGDKFTPSPAAETLIGSGGSALTAFDQGTAWAIGPSINSQQAFEEGTMTVNSIATGTSGWTSATFAGGSPVINAFASSDCRTGWAVGDVGSIWSSSDAAATFIPRTSSAFGATAPSPGLSNLVSVAATSSDQGYTLATVYVLRPGFFDGSISNNFSIFATSDGGLSWSAPILNQQTINVGDGIFEATVVPAGKIATNHSGNIVAVSTALVISGTNGSLDSATYPVCQYDESYPITPWGSAAIKTAPGSPCDGTVMNSPSGLLVAPFETWNAVSLSSDSAWVSDQGGDILWEQFPLPSGSFSNWKLVSISPFAATLYPNYPSGPAIYDANGFPVKSVKDIGAIDCKTAVVVGTGGLIEYTTDQGANWTSVQSHTANDLNAISIYTTSTCSSSAPATGWAVGADGTILKTTDSGKTWTAQTWTKENASFIQSVTFTSVSTPDGLNVWAVGQQPSCTTCLPFVAYSSDGGESWSLQDTGANSLVSVAGVDASTAWVVGANGTILKTLTAGQSRPPLPSD